MNAGLPGAGLQAARLQVARQAAESVTDPELPILTLVQLGVLREVALEGETVVVQITPTYTGCPALATMSADLAESMKRAGFSSVEVRVSLTPAWSSDDITTEGRAALSEAGISPPSAAPIRGGPTALTLLPRARNLTCPRCGSPAAELVSEFGSTACKAHYRCTACLEPFDHIKEI